MNEVLIIIIMRKLFESHARFLYILTCLDCSKTNEMNIRFSYMFDNMIPTESAINTISYIINLQSVHYQ